MADAIATVNDGAPVISHINGQPSIKAASLLLNWRCNDCDSESQQHLTDIPEAGAAICGYCGEDMELLEHVSITGTSERTLPERGAVR